MVGHQQQVLVLNILLTKTFQPRLEYQYYNDVGGPDIHFAGLGLAYHWGAPAPIVEPVYVRSSNCYHA